MRILHIVNQLSKDYCFLSFPLPFEKYQFNVGQLSQPLLKFQTTLFLLIFFNPAELIHTCDVRNLSKESQTSCGGIVAGNNSLLCTHLSFETGKHFCLFVYDFAIQMQMSFGLQMDSGSGLPQATLSFEQHNTILPDVLSLTPYFKSSSIVGVGAPH